MTRASNPSSRCETRSIGRPLQSPAAPQDSYQFRSFERPSTYRLLCNAQNVGAREHPTLADDAEYVWRQDRCPRGRRSWNGLHVPCVPYVLPRGARGTNSCGDRECQFSGRDQRRATSLGLFGLEIRGDRAHPADGARTRAGGRPRQCMVPGMIITPMTEVMFKDP